MLPIRFRQEEEAHPLQALCPWIDFITDDVVLNKDGSLLAGFTYIGLDPDNVFDEQADDATLLLQRAYNQLDENVTAWWILDKRRDFTYDPIEGGNEISARVDHIYSKGFRNGKHYSIRYNFYLLYTGSDGTDQFLDRVARFQSEGLAMPASLMAATQEALSGRAAFARDVNVLRDNIDAFERAIKSFTSNAPLRFIRMNKDELTSSLDTILNRASEPMECRKPQGAMLDSWLPSNYVSTSSDAMRFRGNSRTVYMGALALTRWPETTSPMLFEALASADMELTICQVVRFLGTERSRSEINGAIEYYKLTQYGMLSHAIAKLSGSEPEPQPGKLELLLEAQEALNQLEAEGTNYVYHNATVFVYGDSRKAMENNLDAASRRLAAKHFKVIRERQNVGPCFASMLPGQWSQQVRYDLLSVANLADATPIYTMLEGEKHHPYFSEDIFKRKMPALAVFGNRYGGRFYFVPHVGQVGHMAIVAPTGGGKTTFVNFALSQFQRYEWTNTFIFDRNKSCMATTELHGGKHIDLKSGNAKFNPFFAMMDGSSDGKLWLREFILRRLAEGGFEATADDRANLDEALNEMEAAYQEDPENKKLSMSYLATMVSGRLENELGEWLAGRPYGMFDNEEDDFELSNWTTIEMKEIMATERLARAFMDYAFRKIDCALDGRPTFIYLEEASFLLNNPTFAQALDDWLKTFRKKNAFVWLTIQSPESITSSEIAATLRDNIASFLMCRNERVEACRESYKKNFGLADFQVDQIASLRKNREYLLIQGTTSRVIVTDFDAHCLAYLRSETHVINVYEKLKGSGVPNWKEQYVEQLIAA